MKRFLKTKWLASTAVLVWAALLVATPGCSHDTVGALQKTDVSLTSADGERKAALTDLTVAKGKSQGEVRDHIVSAQTHLDDKHQGKDIAAAKASNKEAIVDVQGLKAAVKKYETNRWVQAALFLQRLFWTSVWTICIGGPLVAAGLVALRIWGVTSGGWIGAASRFVWGLVTLGFAPLFKWADNKAVAKKLKKKQMAVMPSSSPFASSSFAFTP